MCPTCVCANMWRRRAVGRQHLGEVASAVEHRRALAVGAAAVSVSAVGGACGLITGSLDLGPKVSGHLPFHSPAVGGVALACVVAAPMAVAARQAWLNRPNADRSAMSAGALLMGWVTVQPLIIRWFTPLQPIMFAAGAAVAAAGLAHRRASQRAVTSSEVTLGQARASGT